MLSNQMKIEFCGLRDRIIESQYNHLNREQKQAVLSVKGAVLILAGAGSGKTTVLVNRISNIINFGTAYGSKFLRMILLKVLLMKTWII